MADPSDSQKCQLQKAISKASRSLRSFSSRIRADAAPVGSSPNRGLHLPDGPEAVRRDALVAGFPEKFGWIHAFDALETARASLRNFGRYATV